MRARSIIGVAWTILILSRCRGAAKETMAAEPSLQVGEAEAFAFAVLFGVWLTGIAVIALVAAVFGSGKRE